MRREVNFQARTIATFDFLFLFLNDRRKWFTEAKSESCLREKKELFAPSGIDRIKGKGGIMNTRANYRCGGKCRKVESETKSRSAADSVSHDLQRLLLLFTDLGPR